MTQLVCQIALVATSTSGCSETTRTARRARAPPRDAQQLGGLFEVGNLGGGLALGGVERLFGAVDPDHGHARFDARRHVVVVAGRHVHPAALAAHAPRALGEVGRVGLVGADLLGGDDEVEVGRDVAAGLAEELVIDVGQQAQFVFLGELGQLDVGLLERLPALDRVGQKARARGLQLPSPGVLPPRSRYGAAPRRRARRSLPRSRG